MKVTGTDIVFVAVTSALYLVAPSAITKIVPLLYLLALLCSKLTNSSSKRNKSINFVAAGLVLSIIGDVSLAYQAVDFTYFIVGLAFFLLAHVSYIAAYISNGAKVGFSTNAVVVMVAFFVIMMSLLLPRIQDRILFYAIVAYGLTISTMGLLALNKCIEDSSSWPQAASAHSSRMTLLGAVLFIASDTALAIHKFRSPIMCAELIIMSTYYLGQTMIVFSALA
jgi:uncharacterized membrane protein YhhN